MKRVMLYCRVSTEKQAKHGDSIEDQIEALRAWANEHDCIVIGEYIDAGFSGSKPYTTRPEFCRMLKEADELHPDMLLFTRLDRFTRNPRDYYNVAHIFEEHHLQWKAIWQDFDTTTAAGQAMIGTMIVFAKLERDNTSDRIKAHNVEKRARGELVSGKMPRGYIIRDKKPVKDPEKEEAINTFFRSFMTGKGVKQSAEDANKKGAGFGCLRGASYLIEHPEHYTGSIQGIPCDPYLTEEEAQIIQSLRRRNIHKKRWTTLFSGLAKCGVCGRNLSAHARPTHTSYNCAEHYRNVAHPCTNGTNLNENTIEQYLLMNLDAELRNYNYSVQMMREAPAEDKPPQKLETLQKKKQRLIDAYVDELIDKQTFSDRIARIDADIDALIQQSHKVVSEPKEIFLPDDWIEVYNQLEKDGKREFWFRILDRITVFPDRSMIIKFR